MAQRQAEGEYQGCFSREIVNLAPLPPANIIQEKLRGIEEINSWCDKGNRPKPSEEVLTKLFGSLPDEVKRFLAIDRARTGDGDPLEVITALLQGQTIEPEEAVLYLLMVQVTIKTAEEAIKRLPNVTNEQQRRIVREVVKIIARLKREHPGQDDYVFWLVYVGTTTNLIQRPTMDLIDIIFPDDPKTGRRSPLKVMLDVGANVSSMSDCGIISFKDGVPSLHGDPEVIISGLPRSLRIPIVSLKDATEPLEEDGEPALIGYFGPAQLNVDVGGPMHYKLPPWLPPALATQIAGIDNPLAAVHFVSDATGVRNTPFEKSHTGKLVMNLFKDLLSGKLVLPLRITDCHPAPAHPSNVATMQPHELTEFQGAVKKKDLFIALVGSGVALFNVCKHIVTPDVAKKLEKTPFFEAVLATCLDGVERIFLVTAHPGVHNYIGRLEWTMETFALGQALIVIISTTLQRLKHTVPSTKLAQMAFDQVRQNPFVQRLQKMLTLRGNRTAWNGRVAVGISQKLREGSTFEAALYDSACLKCSLITSFLELTPNDPRLNQVIRIPAKHNKEYESWVYVSALVPVAPGSKNTAPFIHPLCLDAHWRGSEDVEGHLYLDDKRSLVFWRLNADIHEGDGEPFILPAWRWRVTKTLGSTVSLLENHLRLTGKWTTPSIFEERLVNAFNPRVVDGVKPHDDYSVKFQSNFVQTLDAAAILNGVARRDIPLIPLGKRKRMLRFWTPSKGLFKTVHEENWDMAFLQKDFGAATHFALSYCFRSNAWSIMLFRMAKDTNFEPNYLEKHPKQFPSTSKRSYIVRHGEKTELFAAEKAGNIGAMT